MRTAIRLIIPLFVFCLLAPDVFAGGDPEMGGAKVEIAAEEPDLSGVERVSPEYVSKKLDDPDVVIVDVRRMDDLIPPEKIAGAIIEDWQKVDEWSQDIPRDKEIISYCS